jgi:hypothetical protein
LESFFGPPIPQTGEKKRKIPEKKGKGKGKGKGVSPFKKAKR